MVSPCERYSIELECLPVQRHGAYYCKLPMGGRKYDIACVKSFACAEALCMKTCLCRDIAKKTACVEALRMKTCLCRGIAKTTACVEALCIKTCLCRGIVKTTACVEAPYMKITCVEALGIITRLRGAFWGEGCL